MKTNNRGKAKNRGKEKNCGKTNNHGKAKMKESCAKKMDDRNVHHAFMPEYVYLWFMVYCIYCKMAEKVWFFLLFFFIGKK